MLTHFVYEWLRALRRKQTIELINSIPTVFIMRNVFNIMNILQTVQILVVFVVISVVDTFSLSDHFDLMIMCFDLMIMFFVGNYWSLYNWNISCKLMKWIGCTSQVCSSYYVLLFTVERFISVRYPLRRAAMWTRKHTNIAIVVIFLTSALLMVYNLRFWISPMNCEWEKL